MTTRERLAGILSAELLDTIATYIEERVTDALAAASASRADEPPWLTLDQAAKRLNCSRDAIRMRVKRGRLEARHDGRRVYVSKRSVDRE